MKIKTKLVILLIIVTNFTFAQNEDLTPDINSNGITKPSILSSHPYGILFSRWQGNFKSQVTAKFNLDISLESGNVWSPPVTAYIPSDPSVRAIASEYLWHDREFIINVNQIEGSTLEVENDGVIRGLRINLNVPINSKSELNLGLRSFLLTRGKFPYSIFTNDEFIEFFHDNIAGGDDPFDRKLYPYNEALIRYQDRNNNVMTIENGDFIFSGIEVTYYRYTNWFKSLNFNYGGHLGVNTSSYNSSLDLGLSANLSKIYALKNDQTFSAGISLGGSKNNLVDFKSDNMEFGTNSFIGYLETILEYSFLSKSKRTRHSFGADFYLQTSLNKKSEYEYIIPTKNGTSFKSWNTGISNLYTNNNYWTFMYSFTKKMTTTFYLQQDLTVNNNPDLQTGVRVAFNI